MGRVSYNNNLIIPASLVNLQKEMQTTGDGTKLGTVFTITLQNSILAYKGSPDSDGTFWTAAGYPPDEDIATNARLASIERKIEAVRNLFSTDGLQLKIESDDGSIPMMCNPKVKSINFPEGVWHDVVDYSIVLEADAISGVITEETFTDKISSANETWNIAENDIPKSYNLTHNVSAVGKFIYPATTPSWQNAKAYVIPRLGYDNAHVFHSALASGVQNFSGLLPFNFKRTEDTDVANGSFAVSETWVLASGTYIEDYTIRVDRASTSTPNTVTVNIDGSVRGLYTNMWDYATAHSNALAGWNIVKTQIPTRVSEYTNGTNFSQGSVTYNKNRGTIDYSYIYDDKSRTSGTFEEYTVSHRFEFSDYRITVSVAGKIFGLLNENETNPDLKYNRAANRWETVRTQLFSRAVTYGSGFANLRATPTSKNVTVDPIEGSVAFNYEFNNRIPEAAQDEFTVVSRFSRDTGFTTVNLQGVVQGFDLSGSGVVLERYNNAIAAFPTEADFYTRAQTYATGITFANSVFEREITRAPNAGSIGYNYVYSTEGGACISGALSEIINVTDNNPGQVIAQVPVLGRQQGPVLQNISTYTARSRDINIEIVIASFSGVACDYVGGYNRKPSTDSILNAIKPTGIQTYKVSDSESWNWKNGRYSRSTSYLYEV